MARNSILVMAAALSLIACGGDKDDTSGTSGTTGTTGGSGCDVEFDVTPGDGTSDWYFDSPVEVALSEADSTATVEVADASGAAVAGSQSTNDDGTILYFTPDGGFAPSTSYSVTVTTCAGGGSSGFSTSDLGAPLAADITGNTYRVDLANARFVKPEGVASLLLDALEDDILVGVESLSGSDLQMIGALSEGLGGEQNTCYPSIPFPAATFTDPGFVVGPADTTLNVGGISLEISQLTISGAFAPDGSYFGGGVLGGELDARVLGPLLEDLLGVSDPDEICGLLVTFGVTCEACSSDGQPYCAEVLADQITAVNDANPIECVDEEECHPSCASSTCLDTSAGLCE